jgi:hypothetical protein
MNRIQYVLDKIKYYPKFNIKSQDSLKCIEWISDKYKDSMSYMNYMIPAA